MWPCKAEAVTSLVSGSVQDVTFRNRGAVSFTASLYTAAVLWHGCCVQLPCLTPRPQSLLQGWVGVGLL